MTRKPTRHCMPGRQRIASAQVTWLDMLWKIPHCWNSWSKRKFRPMNTIRQLRQDMCSRHPEVSPHVLDHLVSLEGLLGVAIISGFSFGAEKARICVVEGPLLGDIISRTGRKPMGDRVQAVRDFAPLRDKQHIQQFLGLY